MVRSKAGTLVDLFSGCGGFSLGAELVGFRSLAAIDIDPTLQSAYRRNFPGSRAIQASVAELEAADWGQLIGAQRPDVVIGGPPCQGFSYIGKRQKDDPRNTLIHHFFRQVSVLRPKCFVMENVEGLLMEESRDVLSKAIETVADRYTVLEPVVVNAADFGAATTRRRVVVVGYDPREVDSLAAEDFAVSREGARATVRDAISDLPSPVPEARGDFGWAKYPGRPPTSLRSRGWFLLPRGYGIHTSPKVYVFQ